MKKCPACGREYESERGFGYISDIGKDRLYHGMFVCEACCSKSNFEYEKLKVARDAARDAARQAAEREAEAARKAKIKKCEICGSECEKRKSISAPGWKYDGRWMCLNCYDKLKDSPELIQAMNTQQVICSGLSEIKDNEFVKDNIDKRLPYHAVIANGVRKIGEQAFMNCKRLKSIVIPAGVTEIGKKAFYGCTDLEEVTLPVGVREISEAAFRNCSSLKSVVIPEGVTKIANDAFWECSSLVSVTIPESVTEIGTFAFCRCASLQSVTIPKNVLEISTSTFYECSSLSSVTLPEGLKKINDSAFHDCLSLKKITIPKSVTDIEKNVFVNTPIEKVGVKASCWPNSFDWTTSFFWLKDENWTADTSGFEVTEVLRGTVKVDAGEIVRFPFAHKRKGVRMYIRVHVDNGKVYVYTMDNKQFDEFKTKGSTPCMIWGSTTKKKDDGKWEDYATSDFRNYVEVTDKTFADDKTFEESAFGVRNLVFMNNEKPVFGAKASETTTVSYRIYEVAAPGAKVTEVTASSLKEEFASELESLYQSKPVEADDERVAGFFTRPSGDERIVIFKDGTMQFCLKKDDKFEVVCIGSTDWKPEIGKYTVKAMYVGSKDGKKCYPFNATEPLNFKFAESDNWWQSLWTTKWGVAKTGGGSGNYIRNLTEAEKAEKEAEEAAADAKAREMYQSKAASYTDENVVHFYVNVSHPGPNKNVYVIFKDGTDQVFNKEKDGTFWVNYIGKTEQDGDKIKLRTLYRHTLNGTVDTFREWTYITDTVEPKENDTMFCNGATFADLCAETWKNLGATPENAPEVWKKKLEDDEAAKVAAEKAAKEAAEAAKAEAKRLAEEEKARAEAEARSPLNKLKSLFKRK